MFIFLFNGISILTSFWTFHSLLLSFSLFFWRASNFTTSSSFQFQSVKLISGELQQTKISTLVLLRRRSFILFRFPQITLASQVNHLSFWPPGCLLQLPKIPRRHRQLESSRLYCCLVPTRLAYCVMAQSPFTIYPNLARHLEPRLAIVDGLAAST